MLILLIILLYSYSPMCSTLTCFQLLYLPSADYRPGSIYSQSLMSNWMAFNLRMLYPTSQCSSTDLPILFVPTLRYSRSTQPYSLVTLHSTALILTTFCS